MLHLLFPKVHLKQTEAKVKNCGQDKSENLFGKHGCHIVQTKEERDHLPCYQHTVQKPADGMWMH